MHAFANLLVVLASLTSLFTVLKDPLNSGDSRQYSDTSLFGNASPWPIYIINAVHVYHMVAFHGQLTSADYFHHLLFIPSVGFVGQYFEWGALRNFFCFFISGFPGGTDYLLLTLVRHGMLQSMVQKRVAASINIWLRGPGITYACAIMWMSWLYSKTTVPAFALFLTSGLSWFNAQYYTKQSVANFAICHTFGHVEERISMTTGMPVPEWGKEAKKPQNTMS